MLADDLPASPAGYSEWTAKGFTPSLSWKLALSAVLAAIALVAPFVDFYVTRTVPQIGKVPHLLTVGFGLVFATVVIHELTHAAVGLFYGCDVSFDARYNVVIRNQLLTRPQLVVFLLAPTALLSLGGLLMMVLGGESVIAFAGYLLFLTNTLGIALDVWRAWRVFQLPRGTLLYTPAIGPSYVTSPDESVKTSLSRDRV